MSFAADGGAHPAPGDEAAAAAAAAGAPGGGATGAGNGRVLPQLAVKTPQLPPWLDHQLTEESALQMLHDLKSSAVDGAAEMDAHAKRLALLVFSYGGDSAQRDHCATPKFADAVALCLTHPTANVRALAIETMGVLASFDENLALPHVPCVMARLGDADDALAVLAILHSDLLPAAG
jgi:hypothetical protein